MAQLTSVVPVGFYVPVGVGISGIVALDTCGLDLFETPLRQVNVACP